ncbi:MAG: hypothetical protein Q9218_007568 [Villophora microphyllina]
MAASVYNQPLFDSSNTISTLSSFNLSPLICSALVISVVLPLCLLVHRDFASFMALGPGGTPKNVLGYLRISYLRLFTLKHPFSPPLPIPGQYPADGFLLKLPKRPQPRPSVAGIAPHRQTDQKPSADIYHLLRIALYSLDSSMHLTLHPADAALVISQGWGERHPLAGCPVLGIGKCLLPEGFVMVYAPQDEKQIEVLHDIVRAAGWWVGGVALASESNAEGVVLTRKVDEHQCAIE